MDFLELTGKMALGSRLRKLSDTVTEHAARIYELYDVELEPRWFPVFYMLAEQGQLSVSAIAQQIGHSHASVSQIVRELRKRDLVQEQKCGSDARRTLVSHTEKGASLLPRLRQQTTDVQAAVEELLSEMQHNLWEAMQETEYLLSRESLYERVQRKKKERASQEVQIIDYTPAHQPDFKRLNVEWIEKYFRLEPKDLESLNNPEDYILAKGGHILLAQYQGATVGACALLKMENNQYELAKMAVSPEAQGLGIGWLLGEACMEKARQLGAHKLYLESNTRLTPALNLYHKLGFRKITGPPSPYERSNIQMELVL